ncbi:helix-turn-helix domain-containing protein [Leuconostoc pseudomesenteroides]|uniref:helix-turn-helix domain-containing protein n=1 Tax=Leuconostoc pseudomesenteroides TaxID=33968 RepID=UPI004035C1FA
MSNRLKELRKNKGLTLKDIQEQTGIKRSTYSDYENENTEPKLATWKQLANFFDVDIPYLQGVNNIPKIPKGLVTRNETENEIHVTTINMDLPDGMTLTQAADEERINHRSEQATDLFYAIYPKPTAKYLNEEHSDYPMRADYFNSVQIASNVFLDLLEHNPSETKITVFTMLISILNSIEEMYDYDENSITFKGFISELEEIKKFYTSSENYDDNVIPWE